MIFNCDKCGNCCRNLKESSLYSDLDRGDGVCKFLVDNLCSIYNERPILCRVEESYSVFFSETLEFDEYIKLNYKACIKLKKGR